MDLVLNDRRAYAYTGGKALDAALPCVVFVHGSAHDHSVWALQSRYLAHHGFGVLALDLPGHGRSAGPALETVEAIADWALAVIAAAGVTRAIVVGHSMGSLVAIECAARAPSVIAGIVLVGTTYPMRVSAELLAATRDAPDRAHAMITVWSHAAIAHYPSNPGPGFWVHGENVRLMERQPAGTLHADFRACDAYRGAEAAAPKVACPALFVLGRRDVMTPARGGRELARRFVDARVAEIAGSGHNVMAEKPDELLDALVPFLHSVAGGPATSGGVRQGASGG